jgi:hypothetical protein
MFRLLIITLVVEPSSCTITKRAHPPGRRVEWHSKNQAPMSIDHSETHLLKVLELQKRKLLIIIV